jgi:hypothetical protein
MQGGGLLDRRQEDVVRDRLLEILERPQRDGLHRRLERRVPGDEDDGDVEVRRAHAPQQVHAGHPGKRDVAHDDVEGAILDRRERRGPVVHDDHLVASGGQHPLQRPREGLVVLHEQHDACGAHVHDLLLVRTTTSRVSPRNCPRSLLVHTGILSTGLARRSA